MTIKYTNTIKKSALFLAIVAISGNLNAQVLEEVVVTATKRAQSMQDVPIAVTAMDERAIQEAGITDISGVALRTPGFSMGSYSAAQPLMYIRGIGSNERGAGGGESSVAVFLDNVYLNRASGAAAELFDLASVEVLRGPQGTLWGKNAAGGVVNMRSRRPSDTFETSLEGTVGNEGIWGVNGLVSGPLGDTVAGKIVLSRRERDAWFESSLDSSGDTGDLETNSARAQLLFNPSESFEGLFTVDYSKDERGGIGVNAQLITGGNPSPAQEAVNYFANLQPEIDFHESFLEEPGEQEVTNGGASLQLDWDIGDMTLTSITAYRESESDLLNSTVGTSLQTFPVLEVMQFTDEEAEMWTQELRLAGGGDSMTWQVGFYYLTEEIDRIEGGDFLVGPLAPLLSPALAPAIGLTLTDKVEQHAEIDSLAAFGQLTWSVTDNLDLTFGARYSEDEKDYENTGTAGIQLFVRENYDISTSESWENPTFNFVANYHFNDDSMVYFSTSTGFKSGGWGSISATEVAAETPFDEEEALNMEIGLKSMWLDNSLRLNAALFRTEYDDLQVVASFDDGVCTVCPISTVNAGEAEINGLELELTWAITDEFQLMGNYAYLDTEYTKFDSGSGLEAFEGNELRNAPENAFNLVGLYETTLATGGDLSFRAEYIYKDDTYQEPQNWEQSVKGSYDLWNLRLGYITENNNWEIAGWIKNAGDEEYLAHSYYQLGFGAVQFPALPRTYGATVTWRNF